MRLFLSINLKDNSLLRLEEWQNELKLRGIKGYWRRRDNLHVTLKFFGSVEKEKLRELIEAIGSAAERVEEFCLEIKGLGVFPNTKHPRILWAGLNNFSCLPELQQEIERQCSNRGFFSEKRDFKPHLTLASGGISGVSRQTLERGKSLTIQENIKEIYLMNSIVDKGIRRYLIVARFPLKSKNA